MIMNSNNHQLTATQVFLRLMLSIFILFGLNSCFDSSTEEAPPSLRQSPQQPKPQPTAKDDTLSVPVDKQGVVDVVSNDAGSGGTIIIIDSFDDISLHGGVVTNNGDGTFTYTPPAGFEGVDSFTYIIKDPDGNAAKATVTIIVSANVEKNGEAFYSANCAICHSAGAVDTTIAFNGTDLAVSSNPLTKDLTRYGGSYQLMGAFYDIEQQNIDELKAYLATL
jgi:hypothetical protein